MNQNAASIDWSKKKRKLQDSQVELPLAKQVCQEKAEIEESEQESANSNSFNANSADSFMCSDDEGETEAEFQETGASDEPSTSWASLCTSSENNRSSPVDSSSRDQPESSSSSVNDGRRCGGHVVHPQIQLYTEKELEELLYTDGVGPGGAGFVLSSGRWPVDQGGEGKQEGRKKLTIDREFEQFFAMLML